MSLIVIKDNHIKFMGTNFFVGNAQIVSVGSIGEKAANFIGTNKLKVKAHIPVPKLEGRIKVAGPFDIDSSESTKSDFSKAISGSLKIIGATISQNDIYRELTTKHLRLVQFFVEEEAMKKAANDSPAALDNLRNYGGDARIAHQLFVIMEAEFATSFTGGNSYEVSVDAGGIISVTANGGTTVSGKNKVTLSPGTGLAYLLLNPNWNKGKTQIESTKVDEWSIN